MFKWCANLLLVFSGLGLTACHSTSSNANEANLVVPLESHKINADRIVFNAVSTGCSTHEDFKIRVDSEDAQQATISVVRIRLDPCKRTAAYEAFELPLLESIKDKRITVNNPIGEAIRK
ncbi:MAG: hypothetical protein HRU48_02665 [Vibrio sp.]|uniref:hypothetical protein n=1 Tax=Vibrio TaxID=662 RepID=UPI001EB282B2|nr:hypothetical protein [Vibrio sp.]NRB66262.1 hypothetical protein [Vibrio sp.]